MKNEIEIRECETLDELAECVRLQRDVFELPETELSPVRHLVVTKNAGGFVLGAFDCTNLAGFVLSVPAFLSGERAFYSHMTGVRPRYQGIGIGAKLKWAQRTRSLAGGVKYIKWTFEPVKARNAFFNLEKLGAIVREFKPNFYGTDYGSTARKGKKLGLASDRLFAEWYLTDAKVAALSEGDEFIENRKTVATIEIMRDWPGMVASNSEKALAEQKRIRGEFETAFGDGLIGRGFRPHEERPAFLLYRD